MQLLRRALKLLLRTPLVSVMDVLIAFNQLYPAAAGSLPAPPAPRAPPAPPTVLAAVEADLRALFARHAAPRNPPPKSNKPP